MSEYSFRGHNKCGHCSRFFSYKDFDEYTNFGNSYDTEPPDPIYLCGSCSRDLEDKMVKEGRMWTPWRPGKFHERAAQRLGWRYSHPRWAAWGEYRDPSKPLPEGWEWEAGSDRGAS